MAEILLTIIFVALVAAATYIHVNTGDDSFSMMMFLAALADGAILLFIIFLKAI